MKEVKKICKYIQQYFKNNFQKFIYEHKRSLI